MSYKFCSIKKENEKVAIFKRVRIPSSFYHKAKGLLGEKKINKHSGMLFKNCNNIHMFGMKIPLDIIFLKADGTIVKCVDNLKPWRVTICSRANMTLELPAGSIKKLNLKTTTKLEIMDE